jgi:hypothetical protein
LPLKKNSLENVSKLRRGRGSSSGTSLSSYPPSPSFSLRCPSRNQWNIPAYRLYLNYASEPKHAAAARVAAIIQSIASGLHDRISLITCALGSCLGEIAGSSPPARLTRTRRPTASDRKRRSFGSRSSWNSRAICGQLLLIRHACGARVSAITFVSFCTARCLWTCTWCLRLVSGRYVASVVGHPVRVPSKVLISR